MSRLHYFGAVVSIALLVAPLTAQNKAMVRHVVVRGTDDAMEVEIQTSGAPISPDTQAISGPDRIVVDFPGALPSAELRALKVNRGLLKGIRSGLFFNNPPITRVVLDLVESQSYQILTAGNTVIVKLGSPAVARSGDSMTAFTSGPRLQDVSLTSGSSHAAQFSTASLAAASAPRASITGMQMARAGQSSAVTTFPETPPEPARPAVSVTYENGMLRIHADKATLAQVLFEVQQQTHAEIAIPAGAEQEQVVADLGPAPARDVLGALLNGSPYNFVFVGEELLLERVILTRRDPSIF